MQDELARIVFGLPVASLWPLTVPYLAGSRLRVVVAAAISALYVLAPELPSFQSVALLLASASVPLALCRGSGETPPLASRSRRDRLTAAGPVLAAFLLGLGAMALIDPSGGRDALEEAVESDPIALVAAGLVGAVFLGGSAVAWILRPFTRALEQSGEASRLPGLSNAGRYIGWFERAVLFGFVMGGEPEAAAVALAAKSFARFPTLSEHHEGFAEYFLIGSLASVAVAIASAAAARATLGIGPF